MRCKGADRLRVVVNAFTRLRFCTAQGVMEFKTKEGADGAPAGFHALVRCAGSPHGWRAAGVWPLVDAGERCNAKAFCRWTRVVCGEAA